MINNETRTSNIHRKYKKIIGTSVACLSIFATLTVGSNTADASIDILQPKIVQAVSYLPSTVEKATFVDGIKAIATQQVGVPYVTGGTSTSGFDCSGFTGYVFKNMGITLPRTSRDQANIDSSAAFSDKTTTITNKEDVQAGDLVFLSNTPGRVSHVGIALDNGSYIHASTSKMSIIKAPRSGSYYNSKFTKAIRIN